MNTIIVGAGGHGQVVAAVLQCARDQGAEECPIGFVDDNPDRLGSSILGLPVLGTIRQLNTLPHDAIILAIGDNRIRKSMWDQLSRQGERFISAIHPSAIIAPDVVFGPGCVVCPGSIVNTGTQVGSNVILNTGCTVDHHSIIDNHAHIAPGCNMGGAVKIGEGGFVGIGSSILPQRVVAPWAIIGGGSLVNRNVPTSVTVAGVPARKL